MSSSSGNTASAIASVRNSWVRTNNAIRSVVSHPLALPLVLCLRFFDDVDTTNELNGDHFMRYLQSLSTEDNPPTKEHSVPPITPDILLNMAWLGDDLKWLVHDLKFTTTVKTVFSAFPLDDLHKNLNDVIKGWMLSTTGSSKKEKALVAGILETFRSCQTKTEVKNDSASSLLFQSEGGVTSKNKSSKKPTTGYYDLLVAQQECGRNSCTPIVLFEFGLNNSLWWQKLDQAYNYLELLTSAESIKPIKKANVEIEIKPLCEKPVLMCTITVDKKTGAFRMALFLCWRRVTSKVTTNQEKMETIHESLAQLSISNESKKDKDSEAFANGFEMVLLGRKMWNPGDKDRMKDPTQSKGNNSDSHGLNEFAKSLVAIFFAMQCMKDWQTKECKGSFLVLGPNCCKIQLLQSGSTPVVLRSYDTRLRPTCRSPHLYLNAKIKKTYGEKFEGEPEQCDQLLNLGRPLLNLANSTAAAENKDVRNFGDTTIDVQKIAEETQQDWLWDNNGKLLLIETTFQESDQKNVHEAMMPGDFIPIINHLQHLHEQGFVHGDIRAFNIVFDGMKGKLIDFDLSGKEGKTRYPLGYKNTLLDGIRCGEAGHLIKKYHDWYALGNVIFAFHEFLVPDNFVEHEEIFQSWLISKIQQGFNKLPAEEAISEESLSSLVRKLKDLLKQIETAKWTCTASKGLYFYYHKNNRDGVDPATGSPQLAVKD